jgi:penicillin-binding protein-related factor A (putative recombinase)
MRQAKTLPQDNESVLAKQIKKAFRASEADIEKAILQYLEFIPGMYAWKNPSAGFFDAKRGKFRKHVSKYAINGTSDILGIWDGRFIAIEVKRPENKERPLDQKLFIDQINRRGGIAFFATSVEDVKKGLGL